jgi:hypothetical protein
MKYTPAGSWAARRCQTKEAIVEWRRTRLRGRDSAEPPAVSCTFAVVAGAAAAMACESPAPGYPSLDEVMQCREFALHASDREFALRRDC